MSSRQPPSAVRGSSTVHPVALQDFPHWHEEGQLVWFTDTVLEVRTPGTIWITPPGGAVWIPSNCVHRVVTPGPGNERLLHIARGACDGLPDRPCIVTLSDELEAAAAVFLECNDGESERPALERLRATIVPAPVAGSREPLPSSPLPSSACNEAVDVRAGTGPLQLIADILELHPDDARTLDDWARFSQTSSTSLRRQVRLATGSSFVDWRRRLRLLAGIRRLAAGMSPQQVQHELGYRTQRAFDTTFERVLGTSPERYFEPLRRERPLASARVTTSQEEPRLWAEAGPERAGLLPRHWHSAGEFLWASTGVRSVATAHGSWVLPANAGIWLPPGEPHEITQPRDLHAYCIMIDLAGCEGLPAEPCVVHVGDDLGRRIDALVARGEGVACHDADARSFLNAIRDAGVSPLPLPLLRESPLSPLFAALRDHPTDAQKRTHWARYLGMSTRTLTRTFRRETGMSLGAWRQLLRLRHGLARLALGDAVSRAAQESGYDSVSSFVAAFRRALGTTPGRYFELERAASPASSS